MKICPPPAAPRNAPAAPMTPPPLSPAYVKDTIAALTASRRSLGIRLDTLDLFGEKHARPDDPVEIQLLFAARDDYLGATTDGTKASALSAMTKLLAQAREACSEVANEMNRLLVAAMQSETAQKKITAMVKIAEQKNSRTTTGLTLADLLENADKETPDDRSTPEEAAGSGRADELQTEPSAGELSPV